MQTLKRPCHAQVESDTTSRSSKGSCKGTTIKKLVEDLLRQESKNEEKLKKIIKENAQFSLQLYHLKSDKAKLEQMSAQALTYQMDRLLRDEQKVDQELSKITCTQQYQEEKLQVQVDHQMDHFSFLRTLWAKRDHSLSSQSKLESLSQKVGAMKRHIQEMTNQESALLSRELSPLTSGQECLKLKRENEQLRERIEKERKYHEGQVETLEGKISELEGRVSELEERNKASSQKIIESYEKQKLKEETLVRLKEKIQGLEIEILHKEREASQHNLQEKRKEKQEEKCSKSFIVASHDNSFLITIKSKLIQSQKSCQTLKTFQEVISFFEGSPLPTLLPTPIQANSSRRLDGMQRRRISIDMTGNAEKCGMRDETPGCSREKKRRFERSRLQFLQK